MKYIIITFSIIMGLFSNTDKQRDFDFDKAWVEVEADINNRLPKSALTKTELIFKEAEKINNKPQQAKCLIYIARLTIETDENGVEHMMQDYESRVRTLSAPLNYIMASYLAELYQNYFNAHRWEISGRSLIEGGQDNSFKTWSSQQFIHVIESWYLYSIQNQNETNIPVGEYKLIMNQYDADGAIFRPTVYEVLVDRALMFFNNYAEYGVSTPLSFQVDDVRYFADASSFSKIKLNDKDTTSVQYKVLRLYQTILKEEIRSKNRFALADYDLKRLEYIYGQSTLDNKTELYAEALRTLAAANKDISYHTDIVSVLANFVIANKQGKEPKVEALKMCNDAIKLHPDSKGAIKCRQIIQEIERPELQIYGEAIYPSDKTMLFALDHSNISGAVAHIYEIPKNFKNATINMTQAEIMSYVRKQKKISSNTIKLHKSPSYDSERTEWTCSGLKHGRYGLIIESANIEDKVAQFMIFGVSDLAYTTYLIGSTRSFVVVDRISGAPVNGATIELRKEKYNSKKREYDFITEGTYKSGKDGTVQFQDVSSSNFKVIIRKGKDELDTDKYFYTYIQNREDGNQYAEFYTDRAIYRPGQTVYYKSILIQNDKNQIPTLIKDKKVTIVFRDANYQEISRIEKKSNEYGSINGSFVLPDGKLNGVFSIHIGEDAKIYGRKSFRVEEYKRPTFEVTTEMPKSVTQLGQKITIQGNAVSLAGVAIDNAEVAYKVTRITSFPFWRGWWPVPDTDGEFIIKQGNTVTNGEGKFNVEFEAVPDKKVKKSDNPVFNYLITFDVTDIQGETRSSSISVSAGYTAFQLTTDLKDKADVANLKFMKISAHNTSGQNLPAKGTVEMFKLKEPETVKIRKYWDGTAQYPLPSSVYLKSLPYYSPKPVNDYSTWETEKVVMQTNFDTKDSIDIKPFLQSGVYKIVTKAKDAFGEEVVGTDYTVITDFSRKNFPKTSFIFTRHNAQSYQPGDNFELNLGTPDSKIQVYVVFEKDGKVLSKHAMSVNKTGKIVIPLTEDHRGGLNYRLVYVKENRWYQEYAHINVPWSNKELNIAFETFRDKTLPGAKEEYRIKITGNNKEKVMAEVLASMYDASLDQFDNQYWRADFYPNSYMSGNLETAGFDIVSGMYYDYADRDIAGDYYIAYPSLIELLDYRNYIAYPRSSGGRIMMKGSRNSSQEYDMQAMPPPPIAESKAESMDGVVEKSVSENKDHLKEENVVQPRTNLKETVFFYPDIQTDQEGNLILKFTMNEALTKWRLMLLTHTKDFKVGYDERFVQTQKELMILPNAPRFFRDGDKASINAKISNLSEKSIAGRATIQIWDAVTMRDITHELITSDVEVSFDVTKGASNGVTWNLTIPEARYNAITYRVSAISANHSDAEESTLPVITNRILVTETMPFWVPGNATRTFNFKAFENNRSLTKKDFRYTFEYTASPVWYAIQALPYIQETNNASTQTLIDRMYANVLASVIVTSHPKIKAVFDQWKMKDKDALVSNLSKNEELKSAILEETPWVRQALSETEQKKNIALLFDLNRLGKEKEVTIQKLRERQLPNGGFPWLAGGRDNVYTTQLILENTGHLYHLGALRMDDPDWSDIVTSSLKYMDERLNERFNNLKTDIKKYGGNLQDDHLDNLSVQYFYIRSFFSHVKVNSVAQEAYDYYWSQMEKYWLKRNLYMQAMIGLVMHRHNNGIAQKIVASLRERSFQKEEMGMYWNEGSGYNWYQLPVERHAMMIELFSEASKKPAELDKMKLWLLKNKQTNHWNTSKATASAIYALLIQGESGGVSKWLVESTEPVIMVGKELINTSTQSTESGTGYIKKNWTSEAINKDQATIKITNNNKSVAWGAAYYQYLENLDQVKHFSDTPLKINKKLYKIESSDKGERLVAVNEKSAIKPGDKIKVRIELSVDREMEFVHMKDMRASGLEPLNVVSSYRYQGGLGYYESTRDMGSHFYFSYLPKGVFVFEYDLRAVHKGDFSTGITTIECMYAPEFSSHSEGFRIQIQ